MKHLLFAALVFGLVGCQSPRVWVLKRDADSGIIAYQNYDPKSDNGQRISELIPCDNHRMTANPITRLSNGGSTYYATGSLITPISDGYTEQGEYHYECASNLNTKLISTKSTECFEQCNQNQRAGILKSSLMDCYQKMCY